MTKNNKNRLFGAIVVALIATVAGLCLAWWNPLEKQQLYLSNFLYYERPTDHQVVVISIDDRTVSSDGLGKFSSWCRTNYVPVLQKLAEYQPAVLGIDILFLNKSEGLCKDDLERVTSSGDPASELNKYLDPTVHPDDQALGEQIERIANLVLISRVVSSVDDERAQLSENEYVQYPLEILRGMTLSGHNRIQADASGLIRYIIPAYLSKDGPVLAFSLTLLKQYLNLGDDPAFSMNDSEMTLEGNGKSIKVPLENYRMEINYNEKPSLEAETYGNVITIPFIKLFNDSEDYSALIKDKIVLIGTRFSSSEDRYQTPIDPTNAMFGVMIHAQAIQTILDRAWLRNITFPWQVALIFMLAGLAAAIIFRLRIGFALPLLAVLVVGYEVAAAPLLFRTQGLILNMVYPPLAIILTSIVGYAYRYVTEFRQKNRVAGALGQYVNADVARDVLAGDSAQVKTGGEKRLITVVFTDIRGFTTISENLQPQSVVALLNEYFEVMTEVIVHNGGTVDKFEGDALMAFFEDKEGLPNQACRAAQSALDMRTALGKLKANWHTAEPLPGGEARPDIDFRVGISTGEAVIGNIGSSRHMQYTVIGDIVNLGSRLESANKKYHTSVMLAEATYEAVKDHYECRFLDMIRVKGKDKPVKVYELICPKGQLSAEQLKMIQAYNKALVLYFERNFVEALEVFQKEVFVRWPADYLSNLYAGRCELLKRFPPAANWDFVYRMETK